MPVPAEIDALDARVSEQFSAAFQGDRAFFEDEDGVCDRAGCLGVLFDHEDGAAFLVDVLDALEQVFHGLRSQAERGLV